MGKGKSGKSSSDDNDVIGGIFHILDFRRDF